MLALGTVVQTAQADGKKWALLIGIEEYDRAEISRLDFAVKDVNAIARALQQNLGYEPSNIRAMTSAIKDPNDSNRPTNDNVIATLERLAKSVGPEDTFLFYFTGHGFNKGGENFLASVNANPLSVNTLRRSAIPLADLQDTMKGFRAKQVLFVIDACRNDPEKGKGEGDNKLTDGFSKSLVVATKSAQAAGGAGVLFACSEGERAFEDPSKGQSVFTYYLLEALAGKAGNKGALAMADATLPNRTNGGQQSGRAGEVRINPKDGAEMIYIPAGPFLMGDDDISDNPRHTVTLSGYWIYKNVVTVGQYKRYCQATGAAMPSAPTFNSGWSKEDHPIVNVSWNDAQAYCKWAGVTLPTEAQWEKAARGTEGRKFPWGDTFDLSKVWASKSQFRDAGGTTAVGQFGMSVYGCSDMSGNVYQWCADWYDKDFWSSRQAEQSDPMNLGVGEQKSRVLRGGSWDNTIQVNFRAANRSRYRPDDRLNIVGFRCASGL